MGQFSSQFRDFLRKHDPGLHFWPSQSLILVQATVFFRSGTFVQADLLTSDENVRSAGVLRSAGVTPVHRYYGPLRLPIASDDGYLFPTPVARAPCHGALARSRISQVPRRSFDARRPLPPRVAHPLQMLVASRMVSGFNIFGRLTTTTLRNEAETGSLTLRLTSSPSRASADEVARAAAELASW